MTSDCKHGHDFSEHFCVNEACPLYGKKGEGNVRFHGHCGVRGDIHELVCTGCRKMFSEFHGTPFYNGKLPPKEVLSIVRHLLEGNGVRGTARLLCHSRKTIERWLSVVAVHLVLVLNELLVKVDAREIQMDEFWTFVLKKEKNTTEEDLRLGYGDNWVHLAMDAVSRLIIAWNVGRRTQESTDCLLADVGARVADPRDALYTSDQHDPYPKAIDKMLASLPQTPDGETERPGPVVVTIKKSYEKGRCVQVERELTRGTPEDAAQRLAESMVSREFNTSFIERLNLTFRQDSRRAARKTLGFSKDPEMHRAQMVLEIAYYNFVRPHRSLPNSGLGCKPLKGAPKTTPAMAAGILGRVWSLLDLISFKVPCRQSLWPLALEIP
jgi:IS1 family transposase